MVAPRWEMLLGKMVKISGQCGVFSAGRWREEGENLNRLLGDGEVLCVV